jgi:sugar phosphate permease
MKNNVNEFATPASLNNMTLTSKVFNSRCYPWLVVFMSCLFLFYKYIVQVSPSVMTGELMHHFNLQATGLSEMVACYFPAYCVTQFLVGPLLDRYSTRLLSCFALLLMSFSLFEFSQSTQLWEAYLWRLLMGVGAAFATVSYLKLVAVWFDARKFSYVAGWLATAASVGGMIAQTPVAMSVQRVGWQHTLYLCSLVGLVVACVYGLLVRSKNPLNQGSAGTVDVKTSMQQVKSLFKSKKLWLLALYSGLAWAPLAVFSGLWGDSFLQVAYHLTKTQAASLVTLTFAGLATGGPLFGWLANRLNQVMPMMLLGLLLSLFGLSYVLFVPFASMFLVSVALFLFGFGTGAFMLGFALGRQWFSVALAATVIAVVNTGDALFGAFTEPMVGKLLDVYRHGMVLHGVPVYNLHSYHYAMLVLPLYLLAATFVLWLLARMSK